MKKYAIGFFAFVIMTACNSKKTTDAVSYAPYIQGLASPVGLKYESTTVYMTDYFDDIKGIEKVALPGCNTSLDTLTGILTITNNIGLPVSNLAVTYKGVIQDIPVFKSQKVNYHFTYKATSAAVKVVELAGSINGWNRKATPLKRNGELWNTDIIINPGLYQYRVWEDGKEIMDANNPDKIDNGMGAYNNTFRAGDVTGKQPRIISTSVTKNLIEVTALDSITNVLAYCQNQLITVTVKASKITVEIPEFCKTLPAASIRIFADNGRQRANDILVPLANGKVITDTKLLTRKNMNAAVMYFALVDRFVDGDTTNNRPTNDAAILPRANNLGGDIKGITQKIEDGYFQKLGVNTIWLSPISENAEGAWGLWDKGVKSKFSAYHGYWPTALRNIDNRFGNDAQFKELISVAHKNNMNVILDYVAHHVHQNHPLIKQKPEWTTPLYLPDGTMNTEKWDEYRLTTWFDTFLPTWKFASHEVVSALTDTAMYWVTNYDLDGFRHDATKHIDEDFWRTLTTKVKKYKSQHPDRLLYQIGETYGNPELISSYINSGELDAQFDFNLYDAEVDAFTKDSTSFENLERVLNESMSYYGSHHLMGNITGNQDRARVISYADGSVLFSEDAKLAGWTRDIQNKGDDGFLKVGMLNAFLMTSPGIPCIYYGDEIGMPGGNDPDNRRMMHFDFNTNQQKLFKLTASLIKLRNENMALTYGDLFVLKNDSDALVFVRSYFGKTVLVVFDKNIKTSDNWSLNISKEFAISNPKKLNGQSFELKDNVLSVKANAPAKYQFEIFY